MKNRMTRDDLIKAVCDGKLSIKDAEREAVLRKLKPLEEIAEFYTEEREYLSLAEALVWIEFRDYKIVCRANDTWRANSKFFYPTMDDRKPYNYDDAKHISYLELGRLLQGKMNEVFKSLCEKIEKNLIEIFFKNKDGILEIFPSIDWSQVELGLNSKSYKAAIRFSNRQDLWLSNGHTDDCYIKSYQLQHAYPSTHAHVATKALTDAEVRQEILDIEAKTGKISPADLIYSILKPIFPKITQKRIRKIVAQMTNFRGRGRPVKSVK